MTAGAHVFARSRGARRYQDCEHGDIPRSTARYHRVLYFKHGEGGKHALRWDSINNYVPEVGRYQLVLRYQLPRYQQVPVPWYQQVPTVLVPVPTVPRYLLVRYRSTYGMIWAVSLYYVYANLQRFSDISFGMCLCLDKGNYRIIAQSLPV